MILNPFSFPVKNPANAGVRQGHINKANRGKKFSQSKGDNKGKAPKWRVMDRRAPLVNGEPVYVYVMADRGKIAVSKAGNAFRVNVGSIPCNQSYEL